MRKFKAKRVHNDEWVFGFYGERGGISYIIQEIIRETGGDSFNDIEVRPETVCIFTGLYDENNDDVYENDEFSCGVVKFDDEDGWLVCGSNCIYRLSRICFSYKLTGNIHETA